MKRITSLPIRTGALVLSLTLLSTAAHGDAVFDFNDGTEFDNVGIGATMTVLDAAKSINVTLTSVDIIGQDGTLASDGVDLHKTNIQGDVNSLGINDAVYSNTNGTYGSESRDFNPGEAWVISFNVDVELVEIDLSGQSEDERMTLSSTAFTDIVLDDGQTGDTHDLGGTAVPAGTEITVTMSALSEVGTATRISYLTVAAVPGVSTGDNLIWAGGDGGNWNTTDANFTGDDTVFSTGDNVTIQTLGSINIDAAGITVGMLADTTGAGTVTLQNGNLTTTGFQKTGAGLLALAEPITLDTGSGVTTLAGGILKVTDGATLTTSSLALSGESTLQVDAGGTLTVSGGGALDTGGATLRTEEPVSLGNLPGSVVEVPFIKSGAGLLTLTGDLGTQTTGPVALDILGGSVTASGSNQLNIGGTITFNGDLVLDGAKIEFHGATVSGTGSIIAQSGNATIDARFQGGEVNVANAIVLESDLIVDAPTGNSQNHLNGPISGAGNLVKNGNGVVVFEGANSYLGTTTVNAGTLRIGSGADSTSGSVGAGDITLNVTTSSGTLEFRRDDAIVVPNLISGTGNVSQVGGPDSSTTLSGLNAYTGITTIRGGTLVASTLANYEEPSSIGAATLAGELDPEQYLLLRDLGVLSYTGPAASTDREFTLGTGGGTISVDGTGPLEFTSDYIIGLDGEDEATRVLTLGGSAPGTSIMNLEITDGIASMHAVTKTGPTTWSLTGDNSYTGDTTVEEGTLSLATDYLDDASNIVIAAGAVLDLPHGLTDTVGTLTAGGAPKPIGVYGALGSGAGAGFELPEITGTGFLNVTAVPASDYDLWAGATGFNLTGGMDDDDDQDGLTNKEEYAFGLDPTSAASVAPVAVPLDKAVGTFTYTRRNTALFSTGLTYTYGYSTTLQGDFTPFSPDLENSDSGDPVEAVTVTLPAALLANATLFVQVTAE